MIRESKKIGLKMLKENLGLIIGSYLLYVLISAVVSTMGGIGKNSIIQLIFSVVTFVLGTIIQLGLLSIFVKIYYGRETKVSDVFSYFSDSAAFGKSILLNAIVALFVMMFSVIAVLIYSAVAFGSITQFTNMMNNFGLEYFNSAQFSGLANATLILFVVICLVAILVSAISQFGVMMIIRKDKLSEHVISNAFSVGLKNMFKYFAFNLSFIGWILLGCIIMTVGLVMLLAAIYANTVSLFGLILILASFIYMFLLALYIQSAEVVYINKILDRDYGRSDEFTDYVVEDTDEVNVDNIVEDYIPQQVVDEDDEE